MRISCRLKYINKVVLFLSILVCLTFISGCKPIAFVFYGIKSNIDFTLYHSQRLVYYEPYFQANNVSLYCLDSPEAFCKNINYFGSIVSTVFFEDLHAQKVYQVSCLDDIRYSFEDLNQTGADPSSIPVADSLFTSIKNYMTQQTQMVYSHHKQNLDQRWNVYVITGRFMGNRVAKRIATIGQIKELNQLYVLDLSVDNTQGLYTEQDFKSSECLSLLSQNVSYCR